MLKKTIKYTDYNGVSRTEDFYFNLTESELVEMDLTKDGGFEEYIRRIVNAKNNAEIVKTFKEVLFKSYGEKSDDGKRFIKSQELSEAFSQTEAYNKLFMEMATDAEVAANFINGLMPAVEETSNIPVPKPAS